MRRWRVDVPWLLAQIGVRKWIAERFVHVPQAVVSACAADAGVTELQWRAVEATQAKLLYDGVVLSASSVLP